MIRMKAEAVVITKPDKNTRLNGCNINMNGKVLLTEAADKGYKGAGTLSGEVVLAVASGGALTTQTIRSLYIGGETYPIQVWRMVGEALGKCEAKEADHGE